MTDDMVTAYLDGIEDYIKTSHICREDVKKLLALVRVYQEANNFYTDAQSSERRNFGNRGNKFAYDRGKLARAAEEKAKEIIDG